MSKRLDYNQIAPAGVKALGGVYGYILQSGLPSELVELVYLRISQINNCAYCLDMHTRDLLKKGQKIEKIALVQAWAEAGNLFDERERLALTYADRITVTDDDVDDELFERLVGTFPFPGSDHRLVYVDVRLPADATYDWISRRSAPTNPRPRWCRSSCRTTRTRWGSSSAAR